MKLNRKIIIPAATLLIGFALAGSATSTIAWYQYSTKANVAYLGTSAGTIGNLKVRLYEGGTQADDAGWTTNLSYTDVNTFLQGKKLTPITTGAMGRDTKIEKFYANPSAGNGPLSKWSDADSTSYVQIPLQFKFVEKDGTVDQQDQTKLVETLVAKDLYVSDLLIQDDYANTKRDLSSAIRVHFDGYQDDAAESAHVHRLASKAGGDTLTIGELDLDGDGDSDKSYEGNDHQAMYGFGPDAANKGTVIKYGAVENVAEEDNKQVSYSASSIVNVKLGTTSAVEGKFLNVLVTIWLEGWQELPKTSNNDENVSSMWDLLSTVNSHFDVGMQFEAKDA